MHAGLVGKGAIERLARLPAEVVISSEFRYQDPILTENDLVVLISQSGETADSLAALRLSKSRGALTLGVVNAVGSSIARWRTRCYTPGGAGDRGGVHQGVHGAADRDVPARADAGAGEGAISPKDVKAVVAEMADEIPGLTGR
jgi:hypothetical protein